MWSRAGKVDDYYFLLFNVWEVVFLKPNLFLTAVDKVPTRTEAASLCIVSRR